MDSRYVGRIWVLSLNDLEAIQILHLLDSLHERVLISYQSWGASWERLEPPIVAALQRATDERDVQILGIELAGRNHFGAKDIDHHRYDGDDRWQPESSLEQVAALLSTPLTEYQTRVAVNDRSYIPGLRREFPSITADEISELRRADRRAQGMKESDEDRARIDVRRAVRSLNRCFLEIVEKPTAAHFDFLFSKIDIEDILLVSPLLWQYSGARVTLLSSRSWPEKHWSGGSADSGYFCIQSPGEKSRRLIRELLEW